MQPCPDISITSYAGVLSVCLVTTCVLALTLNCTSFLHPDKMFLQAPVSAVNADLLASLSRVPSFLPYSHVPTHVVLCLLWAFELPWFGEMTAGTAVRRLGFCAQTYCTLSETLVKLFKSLNLPWVA